MLSVPITRAARLVLRRRPDEAAPLDAVAGVAEQLAALLSAGLAPAAAWGALATLDEGAPAEAAVIAAAADAAGEGAPVADAIERARRAHPASSPSWSVLAAAWAVADAAGAPLARCLAVLAASLRDEAQLRRDARAMLAGPAASARLVAALPVIAVAFGMLLGFDTVGVLLGAPLGIGCLVAGSLLLWTGARWGDRLVARSAVQRPATGIVLELLAVALTSGASMPRAQGIVGSALRAHLPDLDLAAASPTVGLAERAGAPVADLLRSEAARARGAARAEGAARAATLGVRLMIPLGCCVLPAFVLLGVAPLMISVVTGTLGGAP